MRTRAGLGLGVGLFTFALTVWIGCGGSESGASSSSGGTSDGGGSDGSSTNDTGAPDANKTLDAAFDGFIDAPEVTLTYGTCATFRPCGGDEKGSWKVTGGCLSDEVLTDAKTACPGLTTKDEVIKAKGIVTADGTTILRRTQVTLKAKAFIPFSGQCAATTNCQLLAVGAQSQLGFDKVTCTTAADGGTTGGCDCDIEETQRDNVTDTYTKAGNTITTSANDTFDYCVAGSKLTYTQTNTTGGGAAAFPLFIELTK